jgi:hypothetical protein
MFGLCWKLRVSDKMWQQLTIKMVWEKTKRQGKIFRRLHHTFITNLPFMVRN